MKSALSSFLLCIGLMCLHQAYGGVTRREVDSATDAAQSGTCAYTFIVPQENLPTSTHVTETSLSEISDKLDNIQTNLHRLQVSMDVEISIPAKTVPRIYPEDCHHAYVLNGSHLTEGVHLIQPEDYPEPFPVYCEVTDGNVWTVIQRRQDGSVPFGNEWTTYKYGFGYISGEHWLGNEKIFYLLRRGRYKLRVELQDWDNETAYAEYDLFQIGNEDSKYALLLGEYSGNASDSLGYHNGRKFSTKDQDNDDHSICCACASSSYGPAGWWYGACRRANLNGVYYQNGSVNTKGVTWRNWKGSLYSFKKAVMKVEKVHPY